MSENKKYTLLKKEFVEELDTTIHQFKHNKTGAEVVYLENSDDNKVFGIGFKTPPKDNTGTPHILEHCVLAGSRKYKTKEPFMNLVQSSMATYLNASTYPDKTIYPIASRNLQDFKNLTDVYLDAVFYPVIYDEEKVFRQEGWRYDIADVNDPIEIKGVVSSEMRGVYSSPISTAYSMMQEELFPDTIYAYESGGEPYSIRTLEFEDYLDFHREFYHPNNAKIYFYGDLDIDEFLEYLDDEYLGNFDFMEVNPEIEWQEPFAEPKLIEREYSLSSDEDTENKTYAGWGLVVNEFSDTKENMILDVLLEALFNSQAAPVKLAIEEDDLGQDHFAFTDNYKQSALSLILINASRENAEKLTSVVESTLEETVKKGINRRNLEAALNKIEFRLRETNNGAQTGIRYFSKSLNTWLHGSDPVDALKYADTLEELRASLDSNIWEEFVTEKILNNTHRISLIINPVPGLNEKKDEELKEELAMYKESLSADELNELVENNKKLYHWQETDDSPELKATIPTLELKDIDTSVPNPPIEIELKDDYTLLRHELATSGINYSLLSFNANNVEEEDLFYLSILSLLLGSIDTEKHSYSELSTELDLLSGGLNITPGIYRDENTDDVNLRIEVSSKTVTSQNNGLTDLIYEILFNSDFSDDERIKDLLQMELVAKREQISGRGDNFAANRLSAQVKLQAYLAERISGIEYYIRLKDLVNNFDERKENLQVKLKELSDRVFSNSGLIISLTSDSEDIEDFVNTNIELLDRIEFAKNKNVLREFEPTARNEAFTISSNVNYVVKGSNFDDLGLEFKGDMIVMASMLRSTQMHNLIRAKGGAYGNSIRVSSENTLIATSYRDPNITYTLDTYDVLGDWVLEANFTQEELEEFVIGSMSNFDPVLSASAKGRLAYRRFVRNLELADEEVKLEEALASNVEGISAYGKLLNDVMEKSSYVVVGNTKNIEENKELFDEIIAL